MDCVRYGFSIRTDMSLKTIRFGILVRADGIFHVGIGRKFVRRHLLERSEVTQNKFQLRLGFSRRHYSRDLLCSNH